MDLPDPFLCYNRKILQGLPSGCFAREPGHFHSKVGGIVIMSPFAIAQNNKSYTICVTRPENWYWRIYVESKHIDR